ncbi:Meiosis expressed gene 1 protein-like [Oopsacas minuta]|uniref:Meiosis expressed gene 1 protein-like n=1 Tax=Oopsacas minuta TaxID=111878 RepID=A0AAV7JGY1_9METZ|nr:Meiosis expressed gene 1 protein-like [Oopsacas minuta]
MVSKNCHLQLTGTEVKAPPPPKGTKIWTPFIEDLYRLQLSGYINESNYTQLSNEPSIDRWPENEGGFIKKLKRQDGSYYYFNRGRECMDKDVATVQIK